MRTPSETEEPRKYGGRRLQDLGEFRLEEPLVLEYVEGHATLAKTWDLPIAMGEALHTRDAFREYRAQGAVDIVQADATKLSRIDEWLDAAALARCYHLEVFRPVGNRLWISTAPRMQGG